MASKSWRCFHCDELFRSREAAWLHFGPDDGCEKEVPACIDPLRHDEAERIKQLREAQEYALRCQESANNAEDKLDDLAREFEEFKKLTGCSNTHELRMWMDSQQGRVVTANALIEGFRKADPELTARIVG